MIDASLSELLKDLIKAMKAFVEAAKLIESLAVEGLGSGEMVRVKTSKTGYLKGDPKCFSKLRWCKRQIFKWTQKINSQTERIWLFIEEREEAR
ncbi:MAG: hypothetical protein DDT19_02292 [Syntrophomonadaceae bacterium]|nr:hypothetical protein [Bacillota bacterium]